MTSAPTRTWTDDQVAQLLEVVYEAGAIQERQRIADATVELDEAWIQQARGRRDELIAARITSMAGATPDWLQRSVERLRAHDQATTDATKHNPPAYTTWRQVHATVTTTVWERVFWDLSPATQQAHADIAPASYRGRIAQLAHLGQAA